MVKWEKVILTNNWDRTGTAGKDWFRGFMIRNPTLGIRTPEATSYDRMGAFNNHTVDTFFDKLKELKFSLLCLYFHNDIKLFSAYPSVIFFYLLAVL